jgi:hypothetical protein
LKNQSATCDSETKEETWTRILFNAGKLNEPVSCYEVGIMGCTKIEGKYHGTTRGGLEIYSYIVYFQNGKQKEITNTLSVA